MHFAKCRHMHLPYLYLLQQHLKSLNIPRTKPKLNDEYISCMDTKCHFSFHFGLSQPYLNATLYFYDFLQHVEVYGCTLERAAILSCTLKPLCECMIDNIMYVCTFQHSMEIQTTWHITSRRENMKNSFT